MNKVIIVPRDTKYRNAGNIFADLWYKCCGEKLDILTDTESIPDECTQRIVIGNDAVNHVTGNLYFDCKIPELGIRYGTDEYRVFSESVSGTDYLFFAGGRVRSTIYAVYDYFERYGGCSYFWDGDIIRGGSLDLKGVDFFCKPRFEYRGTRYFAHRSLHRFQAEHWSLEDWKREIDWILKKRLNMFMLRIGMDDVFQKAFPDIVSYPESVWQSEEAFVTGFSDRSLFWSLEFRGNLRKQLLNYTSERDLMHPEDCGTMTHWYSQTPSEFMDEVNPSLLEQKGEFTGYYHKENLVWDIRKDENLENYFKLTKAHIENYGSDRIFHTIGLGERGIALNRNENLRIKQYVYHRIMNYLKEHYPNSKLLVASWDLWLMFSPEEVRTLIAQLDPEQSIIFDYTSDTLNETRNFTNWGIVGKFPWIAGIFGGYESHNEFRGNYDIIEKRLKTAKDDSMCKGLVYWPELSHGDTLVLEYFSQNAWCEDVFSVDSMLEKYCRDRYGDKNSQMLEIWREFMPVLQMYSWSMEKDGVQNIVYSAFNLSHVDFSVPYEIPEFMPRGDKQKQNAVSVLKMLSDISGCDTLHRSGGRQGSYNSRACRNKSALCQNTRQQGQQALRRAYNRGRSGRSVFNASHA